MILVGAWEDEHGFNSQNDYRLNQRENNFSGTVRHCLFPHDRVICYLLPVMQEEKNEQKESMSKRKCLRKLNSKPVVH